MDMPETIYSLKEALVHGAVAHNLKLNLTWVEAEGLESKDGSRDYEMQLEGFDGILVPAVPAYQLPFHDLGFQEQGMQILHGFLISL